MAQQHDLIIIGAGPGGYVAAIRAAQLGLNVACVEEAPALGGTCLRVGCIPSKALLESSELYAQARHELAAHGIVVENVRLDLPAMMRRKDQVVTMLTKGVAALLRKNNVTHYAGHGRLAGAHRVVVTGSQGETELQAEHILIATGSRSADLPGVVVDGDRIGTSTEALAFSSVPEHLVVIGAGYIGLEMAAVWSRLGAKVTVLEYLDRILPGMDSELAAEAQKLFAKSGIEFRLSSRVTAARVEGEGCVVECAGAEPIRCSRVLLAVGRVPNTEGLGLESVGIQTDAKGCIPVNEHFATSAPGVYAIGDVIGGAMLAHKAEEEGIACVEHLVTGYGHVNYDAIPAVVYTMPEIASVGKTEDQLKEAATPYRKGVFPFRGNGRARALGHVDGFVKMLAHAETDRILGVHIIGPRAGDLIAEAAAAIEFGASSEDVARTSHAHPTLAEAMKEAALAVDQRAIHV
ncbi:MAG TPA: dihydrolipoyl dehydrogenase [Phycisphaerae bacterium]|nr:dihydrolipoyl dehydrogenase [Phycisphaerae bacterium]HOM52438.1 dihydrolipoyl dehydrogenase [Phycisphaerae bacterium]HPP27712.1 dihydrolipoyl dehydrogenase [Phycisphaerae bacterium]